MKDSVSTSIKDCEEAVGEGLKKVSKMFRSWRKGKPFMQKQKV